MTTCSKIEPLLYLYRDGELSTEEKKLLQMHLGSCEQCQAILRDLLQMENTLASERDRVTEVEVDEELVDATVNQISRRGAKTPSGKFVPSPGYVLLYWLRPALGFLLAGLSILYIVQQSRDMNRLNGLEYRLQNQADHRATSGGQFAIKGIGVNDVTTLFDPAGNLSSVLKLRTSEAGNIPLSLLGPGILDIFRNDRRIFEEFERRYPHLSTITLSDSLDERERKILATEGKAFLKDFEKLLQEGEK